MTEEKRTLVGRLQRKLLAPWFDVAYYWLDLKSAPGPGAPNGHPDHAKVLSTVAFFFGLAGVAIFGRTTIELCGAVSRILEGAVTAAHPIDADALGQLVRACALATTALLAYAALVFGMAFGLAGFRTWAKTRGGGTGDALAKAAEAAAAPAIAARRTQGGDYEATE